MTWPMWSIYQTSNGTRVVIVSSGADAEVFTAVQIEPHHAPRPASWNDIPAPFTVYPFSNLPFSFGRPVNPKPGFDLVSLERPRP